jgi:hypothetical protein
MGNWKVYSEKLGKGCVMSAPVQSDIGSTTSACLEKHQRKLNISEKNFHELLLLFLRYTTPICS